ncbi:Exo70 exocyst complex subunit [Backusella circina FSU 941]|nr:Exo70 exocyst complex subunit [Backusella circina FSU 941]
MNGLSGKLTNILDSFDNRLFKLEESVLPIHKATQNLTKLANNIDSTMKSTEEIIECLNMPSIEEPIIEIGPNENDLIPYLRAMGHLKDGIDTIEKGYLHSCDKTVQMMKQLLNTGMVHLEKLFRKCLVATSQPIDVPTILTLTREWMDTDEMQQLALLSENIVSSEREVGYSVDFTKPYIDIRSNFLQKSLHPCLIAVQASDKHQGISYERGTSEFLKYTDCYAKLLEIEYLFAEKIILSDPGAAMNGSIVEATVEYTSAGRQLVLNARKLNYTETTFVFDIIHRYDSEYAAYFDHLSRVIALSDVFEMMDGFKLTVLQHFYEFMEDVKGRKETHQNAHLSSDGTVHETTSNALNFLKRLYAWRDTVEPLLILLGDGNWNYPPSSQVVMDASRYPMGETALGAALLQKFFVDALDQIVIALQTKAKGYKKLTLATLFLLNNYNHILKQIRSPPLNALFDDGSEMKFGTLVKKQLDAYQESWKPCIENLMDVSYVKGGGLKTSMGSGERQLVKERFKSFNTEFEEISKAQQMYAIPDMELRNQVIRGVKNVLVPMYGRFLDKYQGTDFTKNPSKYIRYDKEKIDRTISHLFEPTA